MLRGGCGVSHQKTRSMQGLTPKTHRACIPSICQQMQPSRYRQTSFLGLITMVQVAVACKGTMHDSPVGLPVPIRSLSRDIRPKVNWDLFLNQGHLDVQVLPAPDPGWYNSHSCYQSKLQAIGRRTTMARKGLMMGAVAMQSTTQDIIKRCSFLCRQLA